MARWRELARKAPLDLAACLWRLSKSKLHLYEDTYNTHTGLYKRLNVLFVLLLKFVQMASNLYPPPPPIAEDAFGCFVMERLDQRRTVFRRRRLSHCQV